MDFEILINDSFLNIAGNIFSPIGNKYLMSIINDYEDGIWRFTKFQNFIWDNIAETALSHRERQSLVNHSLLVASARNLRLAEDDEIGKGSELAEIVLYGIMKHHYNALPVVPKIFYKQNVQDNAKGADSVHIVLDDRDDFTLWLGEAKFYNSLEDVRLDKIIQSINSLLQTTKLKKENCIITSVSDLDLLDLNDQLVKKIKHLLNDNTSLDLLKPRLNIPILLIHECKITNDCNSLTDGYKESIVSMHKERAEAYFRKQIAVLGSVFSYENIKFHLILFPVPSKSFIVDKFVANVKHYKEQ